MEGRIRRVVTGHDENGKAIVIADGPAPAVRTNPLRPGHISVDLWKTDASHRTETVDYAVALEGEIVMLLDDTDVHLKAGDVVIQRGTNHAWSNRSDRPCRMC